MNAGDSGRQGLTRRDLIAGASGAALLGFNAQSRPALSQERAIRVLCWGGYDNPTALDPFRRSSGIGVAVDVITANDEIFLTLRGYGEGRYDVVMPTDGVVAGLAEVGLIQPIDLARLSNFPNVFPSLQAPEWATFNGQAYAAPMLWHRTPVVFNPGTLPDPPESWIDLGTEKFAKRLVMLDDAVGHFLLWNRVFGLQNPAYVSKSELGNTADFLFRLKRANVASFTSDLNEAARVLSSGRAWASTTGLESITNQPNAAGANLKLSHPQPGDFSVCVAMCIPSAAIDVDAAYQFIDHMISREPQVVLANALRHATVNATAIAELDEDTRTLVDYDDLDATFAISPLLGFPPLTQVESEIASYVDWVVSWDRIRFTATSLQVAPTEAPTVDATPVE